MAYHLHLNETGDALILLDQTRLPNREIFLEVRSPEALFEAIAMLRVRGAPAIGMAAALGMSAFCGGYSEESVERFLARFRADCDYLNGARPTAVNLSWALTRLCRALENRAEVGECTVCQLKELCRKEALAICREDELACRKIGEYGLELLKPGDGILTHCNAGELAASRYGTALAPILLGKERGMEFRVFADETRPLLQGARLTAYELDRAGVDVTLICDNMASLVMKKGWIQACIVGCDRVAANGDTANKIGTSGVAILAKHYGIPFYVMCPTSTIDADCPCGDSIVVEQRAGEEIGSLYFAEPMAPRGIRTFNPAFDVTPAELITAIVTEYGICRPPYSKSLARAFEAHQKRLK